MFETPGITKNGQLSRGISVGNAQSVFANSSLNLQLEGNLSDDLKLRAVISDQNIPYQPEGTTQQLQDFDKVFIEAYNDNTKLAAGDLIFQNPDDSYFLKYYKNVQGGRVTHRQLDSSATIESTGGVSISKGKFFSFPVPVREGVQGPYKILGPDNEAFILILSNTERVYLDGVLLERGWDRDYVIDYNQALITFTEKVIITHFSRLRVDFEYSDRNYLRTTSLAGIKYNKSDYELRVNYYQERDSRNRPLLQNLSNEEITLLRQEGDNIENLFLNLVDSAGYVSDEIRYKKETILDPFNQPVEVFVYSTNPDSAVFAVSFSNVGVGAGDYERGQSTANGVVYDYVGQGNGSHIASRGVISPKNKRMWTLAGTTAIGDQGRLSAELALSKSDDNLISEIDDADDDGYAARVSYQQDSIRLSKHYHLQSGLSYEFVNATFRQIDRFRHPDFDRDWGSSENVLADQHIGNLSLVAHKDRFNHFSYELGLFSKVNDARAYQNKFKIKKRFGDRVYFNSYFFNSRNEVGNKFVRWEKMNNDLKVRVGKFFIGGKYNIDHNQNLIEGQRSTLMYFDEWEPYLQTTDTTKHMLHLRYQRRVDRDTVNNELDVFSESNMWKVNMASKKSKIGRVYTTLTYREMNFIRQGLETSLTGKVQWRKAFKNRFKNSLSYSTSTSQELQRELVFTQVPLGQGTHRFLDLNEDGAQDLNEFLVDDLAGEYILTFLPTNEFVNGFSSSLAYNFTLHFKGHKWLSRFMLNGDYLIRSKTTSELLQERFIPFLASSSELINFNQNNRTTLFYNRNNPKWGIDLTYQQTNRKQLYTRGVDSNGLEKLYLNHRINFNQSITQKTSLGRLVDANFASFLPTNRYQIQSWYSDTEMQFMINTRFRISALYDLKYKDNIMNNEEVWWNEVGMSGRMGSLSKRNLEFRGSVVVISDNQGGDFTNRVIAYRMLEALDSGVNVRWFLSWRETLVNGLQLNVVYEGRRPATTRTIHVGRIMVSALF